MKTKKSGPPCPKCRAEVIGFKRHDIVMNEDWTEVTGATLHPCGHEVDKDGLQAVVTYAHANGAGFRKT